METDNKRIFIGGQEILEAKLYRWAGLINSLACIILDGEPTSNDLDLANDAIKEVLPYLG